MPSYEAPNELLDDYLLRTPDPHVPAALKNIVSLLAITEYPHDMSYDQMLQGEGGLDEDGRLISPIPITHGHYRLVSDPAVIQIDPVEKIESTIYLSKLRGGRIYDLTAFTMAGFILHMQYYEDMPKINNESWSIVNDEVTQRFMLSRGEYATRGVEDRDVAVIAAVAANVKKAFDADLLEANDELGSACRCY